LSLETAKPASQINDIIATLGGMYPFDTPLVIFLINILFLGLCLHKDMTKITNKQIKENKKKSFYSLCYIFAKK